MIPTDAPRVRGGVGWRLFPAWDAAWARAPPPCPARSLLTPISAPQILLLIDIEQSYINTNHEDFIGFAKYVHFGTAAGGAAPVATRPQGRQSSRDSLSGLGGSLSGVPG